MGKQETTKVVLDAYFNEYGAADSYIMMDKATGRSRGFGFVNFRDEQVKHKVLKQASHMVDGYTITCSDYQDSGGATGKRPPTSQGSERAKRSAHYPGLLGR